MSSIVVFSSHETEEVAKKLVDELVRRNFKAQFCKPDDFVNSVSQFKAAIVIPSLSVEKSKYLRRNISYCELSCIPIFQVSVEQENYGLKGWLKLLLMGKKNVKVSEGQNLVESVDRLSKFFDKEVKSGENIIDERMVFEKVFKGKVFELEWLRNKDGHVRRGIGGDTWPFSTENNLGISLQCTVL